MFPHRAARYTFGIVVAMVSLLFSARADACSCSDALQGTCSGLAGVEAVFSGEILKIEIGERTMVSGGPPWRFRRVTVRVIEPFIGKVSGEVEVRTGVGDADCGYAFVVGSRYLIFANDSGLYGDISGLTTGICNATKLLSNAAAELAYLRAPATPGQEARVTGKAILELREEGSRSTIARPAAGVRVVLDDGTLTREAVTDADGAFKLTAPVGAFAVRAIAPADDYVAFPGTTRPLTIGDPRACPAINVFVRRRPPAAPK